MNIKINHATQKTQRQTHGTTGLCELFLLTVPIEEVSHCQYKKFQIIFPLNLQTRDPIMVKLSQRSRSHGHKIYTAKMHHKTLLGGPINFIVGGLHVDDP